MSGRSLKDAWDFYLAGRADLPHSPEYDEALRVLDEIIADRASDRRPAPPQERTGERSLPLSPLVVNILGHNTAERVP